MAGNFSEAQRTEIAAIIAQAIAMVNHAGIATPCQSQKTEAQAPARNEHLISGLEITVTSIPILKLLR